MAQSGYEFAKRVLTREYVEKTMEKIFWSLPNMSRFARIHTRRKIARFVRKSKKTEKIYSPKSPAFAPKSPDFSPPISQKPLPFWQDPNFIPKSPDETPPPLQNLIPKSPDETPPPLPKSPEESPPVLSSIIENSIMPQIEPLIEELDIIEFPPGAKKCPNGYTVVTINGKKMCKRKKNK
jgi:hypothetical protein